MAQTDIPIGVRWLAIALAALRDIHGPRVAGPPEAWAGLLAHLRDAEQLFLRLGRADGHAALWTAADIIDEVKCGQVEAQNFETAAGWRDVVEALRKAGKAHGTG